MRPGLILWVVFDLAFAAWQYERIGRVTDSMILTVAFHAWYVFDAEFNEVRASPSFSLKLASDPDADALSLPLAGRYPHDHGASSLLSWRICAARC